MQTPYPHSRARKTSDEDDSFDSTAASSRSDKTESNSQEQAPEFFRSTERAMRRDKSHSNALLSNRQPTIEDYWRPLTASQVLDAKKKPAAQAGNIEEDKEEGETIVLEPRRPRQASIGQVDQRSAHSALGDKRAPAEGNAKLDLETHLSRRRSEWAEEERSIIRMLVAERDEALAEACECRKERDRALRERDRLMKEGANFNPLKRLKPGVSKEEILRWAHELQQEDSDSDDSVILGPRRKKKRI